MDGGGRFLRSLSPGGAGVLAEGRPRFASPFAILAGLQKPAAPVRSRRRTGATKKRITSAPGLGTVLVVALMAGTGLYGAVRNGDYATFTGQYGGPADLVAKALGFSIGAIRITGLASLTPGEILRDANLDPRNSLALLDPVAVRDRLKSVPLIGDVSVRKLYPNDLRIDVTERGAAAVWQKDGQLQVIAADGVPIDGVHDDRFNGLPFVVGEGANEHLAEFETLLAAAGELRDKVRAGVYVGERRWTLQMDSGVEVELPELEAAETLKRLAEIDRQSRILEKDVISIDLRIPGRITARLTEEAAAARVEMLAKRPKRKADPA